MRHRATFAISHSDEAVSRNCENTASGRIRYRGIIPPLELASAFAPIDFPAELWGNRAEFVARLFTTWSIVLIRPRVRFTDPPI